MRCAGSSARRCTPNTSHSRIRSRAKHWPSTPNRRAISSICWMRCARMQELEASAQRTLMEADWIIPDWPAPAVVRATVATREGPERARQSPYGFNVSTRCGDDQNAVAKNRAFLHEALSLPSEPRWLRQVHGTAVVRFSLPPLAGEGARRADGGNAATEHPVEPEADAAVTRTPGIVLAIQTADCLPVFLCIDDGSEVAAAHAGWRGLSAGVLENTLAAMQAPRANIIAWLGPAIAAKSYEVGEEVREAFLARQRLQRAGVTRIFGGGFDTFTDPRLHSYRRDGAHSGRMVSLIWTLPAAS